MSDVNMAILLEWDKVVCRRKRKITRSLVGDGINNSIFLLKTIIFWITMLIWNTKITRSLVGDDVKSFNFLVITTIILTEFWKITRSLVGDDVIFNFLVITMIVLTIFWITMLICKTKITRSLVGDDVKSPIFWVITKETCLLDWDMVWTVLTKSAKRVRVSLIETVSYE